MFITVEDIKNELGTNVNYIYDLLACGYIKHIKVGRNYKIKREWYDEFIVDYKDNDLPSYEVLRERAYAIRNAERKGVA